MDCVKCGDEIHDGNPSHVYELVRLGDEDGRMRLCGECGNELSDAPADECFGVRNCQNNLTWALVTEAADRSIEDGDIEITIGPKPIYCSEHVPKHGEPPN